MAAIAALSFAPNLKVLLLRIDGYDNDATSYNDELTCCYNAIAWMACSKSLIDVYMYSFDHGLTAALKMQLKLQDMTLL